MLLCVQDTKEEEEEMVISQSPCGNSDAIDRGGAWGDARTRTSCSTTSKRREERYGSEKPAVKGRGGSAP